jgi:hypothetical protein
MNPYGISIVLQMSRLRRLFMEGDLYMLRKRTLWFALLVLTVSLPTPVLAQKWVPLGQANIDGDGDHDRIRVSDDRGLFRAIHFTVEKGAVDFDRVVAHYESGEDDVLPLRQTVPAGRATRRLDLRGGQRKLDSVEVWYQRGGIDRSDKPRIRLMGIRY